MALIHDDACPFCAQPLNVSRLLSAYREYFSEAYAALKQEIATFAQGVQRTHGGEVTAAFERNVRVVVQGEQFWRQFTEIPELTLDTAAIVRDWQAAFRVVTAALAAKAQAPLDVIQFSTEAVAAIETHQQNLTVVAAYNARLAEANREIEVVKERAQNANATVIRANLARPQAVRARHRAEMISLRDEYLAAKRKQMF
jgi:wobble nucleotide-excising tRNase